MAEMSSVCFPPLDRAAEKDEWSPVTDDHQSRSSLVDSSSSKASSSDS